MVKLMYRSAIYLISSLGGLDNTFRQDSTKYLILYHITLCEQLKEGRWESRCKKKKIVLRVNMYIGWETLKRGIRIYDASVKKGRAREIQIRASHTLKIFRPLQLRQGVAESCG